MKVNRFPLFFILIPLLLSIPAGATPSGLTFLDSTWANESYDETNFLEVTEDYIIAAHDDNLVIYDKSNNTVVSEFNFPEMSAIKVSQDGKTLAVNKAYTVQEPESLAMIDLENMTLYSQEGITDSAVVDMDWHPNGDYLATTNRDEIPVILRKEDLSTKNRLTGVHNVEVKCIDYRPDGQYLITGDESGRYAIWDSNGSAVSEREFGQGLVDCKFSTDGQNYILIGENGLIKSRSFTGSLNNEVTVQGAQKAIFSQVENRIHIIVDSPDYKGVDTLDFETFNLEIKTSFFHRVNDVEIDEDEYGRISTIYVASNTGQVAIYMKRLLADGYGEAGNDFDGDLIPDNFDEDDDGDGIADSWDDAFGCDAPAGTPCSQYPDLSKIRSVEFKFSDEKIVIEDTVTLPTGYSSDVRNFSRNSLATDQVISNNEELLFSKAICDNLIVNDIIENWKNTLSFSTGELGDSSVRCNVKSGVEAVKKDDSVTQIRFSIITEFNFSTPPTYPLEFSIEEQTGPTDGSITWISPSHPNSITVSGSSVENQEIPLWWNTGNTLYLTIDEKVIETENNVDKAVNLLTNPLVIAMIIVMSSALVFILIKSRSRYKIDLDDYEEQEDVIVEDEKEQEVFEDDYDLEEDLEEYEEESEDEDDFEEEYDYEETYQEPKKYSKKKISSSKNVVAKKKMFVSNPNEGQLPKVRKTRTVVSGNQEGPITKTKRRKLSSVEVNDDKKDTEGIISSRPVKKKAVKTDEEKPKIRKKKITKKDNQEKNIQVEDNKDEAIESTDEEPKAREKKKPKRRKPTRKKSDDVAVLDEKSLQDNLLTDFTNDD